MNASRAMVLQAVAFARMVKRTSLQVLSEALELAEPGGFHPVSSWTRVIPWLSCWRGGRARILPHYTRKLQAAF